MREVLMGIILLTTTLVNAQGRYDANWAFGSNCGLSFLPNDQYVFFEPKIFNLESAASYSDSAGNLILYAGFRDNIKLFDGRFNPVANGDFLNAHLSNTNGLIILDFPFDSSYVLFSLDYGISLSCGATPCDSLYFTRLHSNQGMSVYSKNNLVNGGPYHEKLTAIRHANGNDWWVIVREAFNNTVVPNNYAILQVSKDSVWFNRAINVGYPVYSGVFGEMTTNRHGNLIAMTYPSEQTVEILKFDRCTGSIEHIYDFQFSSFEPYSVEFSESDTIIYLSGHPDDSGGLSQVIFNANFTSHNINHLWTAPSSVGVGQLEMGIDNRIYLSTLIWGLPTDTATKYLSVIHQPDSIGHACDFRPFSLYMGDSCLLTAGLPNMPNYNLGATTIYQADAGVDTFICEGDTTIKGIQIGDAPIAGVQYNWTNSSIPPSSKESSRVFVSPTQSTWYYLELSDTSITGSCTSRIDSVLVEVRNCADTLNDIGIKDSDLSYVSIYPNPAQDKLHIQGLSQNEVVSFKLLNFHGQQVYRQQLDQAAVIDISQLASGIYIYTLTTQKGVTTGKVLLK